MVNTRETRTAACEIKFLIEPVVAWRLREWARAHLVADPYGRGPYGDEYKISSLYFDTERLDVFHRRRSHGRAKYRIRRYGDSNVVFLERKLRKPRILIKRRTFDSIDALDHLKSSASAHGLVRRVVSPAVGATPASSGVPGCVPSSRADDCRC